MRRNKFFSLIILLTMLVGLGVIPASAQVQDHAPYFQETGHYVTGDFLDFYNANDDALELYGYPITEQIKDPYGKTVQYFQRVRFELVPGAPPGRNVILTELGDFFKVPGQALPVSLNRYTPGCQQDATWDIPVCYAFLDYFLKYGGENHFGEPITPIELHGDRLMQYFRYARLEYHPDNPTEFHIKLGDLGKLYFLKIGQDRVELLPVLDEASPPVEIDLKVRVFTEQASLAAGGTQTVFITVSDPYNNPLSDALVSGFVTLPSGYIITLTPESTAAGFAKINFEIPGDQTLVGEATITINVVYIISSATTTTSFRIWH